MSSSILGHDTIVDTIKRIRISNFQTPLANSNPFHSIFSSILQCPNIPSNSHTVHPSIMIFLPKLFIPTPNTLPEEVSFFPIRTNFKSCQSIEITYNSYSSLLNHNALKPSRRQHIEESQEKDSSKKGKCSTSYSNITNGKKSISACVIYGEEYNKRVQDSAND
ncbi:hypothetical protein EYC80_004167 [Monilinia laxa]|uniref:Uncharacterized protein n=1 Tax=Monilinia laxa TaxID=61186 RepID=A0A5N6KMA7_MONLA|nr:hypothetical protein EYC80_004167 [Monilinia laxa]